MSFMGFSGRSLMYMLKRMGPRTEPCGTPDSTCLIVEFSLFNLTMKDPLLIKLLMVFIKLVGKLYSCSLKKSPLCHTESKALFRSKRTIAEKRFLLCSWGFSLERILYS